MAAGVLVSIVGCGCVAQPLALQISGYAVKELSSRQLFTQGELIGYLRELEIQQPSAPVRYFRIETVSRGWVGNIDGYGRFYKCEPFRDQPVPIGMYPMTEGLGRLFGIETPIRIVTLGKPGEAAAEASARIRRLQEARVAPD